MGDTFFLFKRLLVAWLLMAATLSLSGQHIVVFDTLYGADPLLVNGKVYTFFLSAETSGNPYLSGSGYEMGSLRLKHINYDGQALRYDIYNQLLILGFVNAQGAESQIIVSDAFLQGFSLGERFFTRPPTADSALKFIQLTGDTTLGIAWSWYKTLALDSKVGATNYVFSKAKYHSYLMRHGQLFPFKNRKSFLKLFKAEEKVTMKALLKSLDINIRRMNTRQADLLIEQFTKSRKP